MNELDLILKELIKEKGGTKESYRNLLNSIAYHESAHTMDPTLKQYGGGPGRGKYQFEEGDHKGGITAAKRTKQYLESKGIDIPAWLDNVTSNTSLDASELTANQQDVLFLGNMRMHPKADFSKVWKGEETVPDFWANYHWAGNPADRKDRLNAFNTSLDKYKENIPQQNENNRRSTVLKTPEQIKDNTNIKQPKLQNNLIPDNKSVEDLVSYVKSSQMREGGKLNEFNEGGLHETNPYGGIPQGPKATVEEGETSAILPIGKFIFSDRVKLDGSGISNTQGFANGGKVDPTDPPNKKVSKFYRDYISSNKFKERLENMQYENPIEEQSIRLNNVLKTGIINQDKHLSFLEKIEKEIKNEPYSNNGSIFDNKSRNIIFSKEQLNNLKKDYPNLTKEEILAHEYGHAINYDPKLNSRLNENEFNELKNRLKSTTKDKASRMMEENYSDIQGFRYLLQEDGIYNTVNEKFKKEHLKKAKNSFLKKRLQKNYSDKDIIWLMNNIANNNKISKNGTKYS